MREKRAHKGAATKERPMVTANLDCALVSELDINNTKTDLAMVLPDSGWAEFKALGSKESSATANAFDKMKHRVQSLTDPGGINDYKIQRVQVDPGSEFRGDFEAACARDNIVLTRGGGRSKIGWSLCRGFHWHYSPTSIGYGQERLDL